MGISIKRISFLSSLGFMLTLALACASSGCSSRDGVDCNVWSGCDEDVPDDGVEHPRDTFDPDFSEAVADPVRDTETPGDVPNGPPKTDPVTVPDAPCCAPTNPPTLAISALPTSTLSGGLNAIHRLIVTASAEDVHFKKLAYSACSTSPSGEINSPALREVGMGSDLAGAADVKLDPEGCGAGNSLYTVTVTLATPFTVAAYQSRTLELRVIALAFQSGESLTTGVREDLDGPACGALTGSCTDVGIGNTVQNIIWSHDLTTWHNGDSVDWSPAGAQTVMVP